MQQPLLKNLLSVPDAAFRCVSVHKVFGFISRFTGSRFWLHRLNFCSAVGGRLASPGGDSSSLELVFKGVHKCSSRTRLGSENMDFQSYSCRRFPVWSLALHLVLLKVSQCPLTMGNDQCLGASVCIFNMEVIVVCPNKTSYTFLSTSLVRKMQ